MLPKGYLSYTFSPLLYIFLAFFIGYILSKAGISFITSLYKLLLLLSMLFLLEIIVYKVKRKYFPKKKKRRIRFRAPDEYRDLIYGRDPY